MSEAASADVDVEAAAEGRGVRGAPITSAIIAACVGVYAGQVALAGGPRFILGGASAGDVNRWNWILRVLGANDSHFTIADTRIETLVTSCFLHGSILHLGFNLIVLWQVGPFLERAIGRARFLPLYLGAGIVGSAFSAIGGRFFGGSMSVGASGAICGLLGAILVLGLRTQGWRGPLARQMAMWLSFFFLLGLAQNLQAGEIRVDNAAHVGGALGGAMIAATWRRGFTYSPKQQLAIVIASTALVALAGITVFVRNKTDPYVFMGVEQRMRAAWNLARQGRCGEADVAMKRALRMDPGNSAMHALAKEIDRECLVNPRTP